MLKAIIVQLLYKPAFIDWDGADTIDYLKEPGMYERFLGKSLCSLLNSEHYVEIEDLQYRFYREYLQHLQQKLRSIVRWAAIERHADLILFPEYAVPHECLLPLRELAKAHRVTILAGSHVVDAAAQGAQYAAAGLGDAFSEEHDRQSVAPIFFSDGSAGYQCKRTRSTYEPNLSLPTLAADNAMKVFRLHTRDGGDYCFSVAICVDLLRRAFMRELHRNAYAHREHSYFVLCPSLSPSTSEFHAIATQLLEQGVPMFYANSSRYGGSTCFERRQSDAMQPDRRLSEPEEGALEIHFDAEGPQAAQKVFHFYYQDKSDWLPSYCRLLESIHALLEKREYVPIVRSIIQHQDAYSGYLPDDISARLNAFVHKLNTYEQPPEALLDSLSIVPLQGLQSTASLFGYEAQKAIEFIVYKLKANGWDQDLFGALPMLLKAQSLFPASAFLLGARAQPPLSPDKRSDPLPPKSKK